LVAARGAISLIFSAAVNHSKRIRSENKISNPSRYPAKLGVWCELGIIYHIQIIQVYALADGWLPATHFSLRLWMKSVVVGDHVVKGASDWTFVAIGRQLMI
jgi:hypothetical protein